MRFLALRIKINFATIDVYVNVSVTSTLLPPRQTDSVLVCARLFPNHTSAQLNKHV